MVTRCRKLGLLSRHTNFSRSLPRVDQGAKSYYFPFEGHFLDQVVVVEGFLFLFGAIFCSYYCLVVVMCDDIYNVDDLYLVWALFIL